MVEGKEGKGGEWWREGRRMVDHYCVWIVVLICSLWKAYKQCSMEKERENLLSGVRVGETRRCVCECVLHYVAGTMLMM